MRLNKSFTPDFISAALRKEEKRLKFLLETIELNDANQDMVVFYIQQIEKGLRRIRHAA
jgi:uncharacterized coiled-coil DUF342 family protein